MPKQTSIQYSFTSGVLDDSAVNRPDIESYNQGAIKLENMVPETFGGVKTRYGTEYILDITTQNNIANSVIIPFTDAENNEFLVVHGGGFAEIIDLKTKKVVKKLTNPNGSSLPKDFSQTQDTLILVDGDTKPSRINKNENVAGGWEWIEVQIGALAEPTKVKNNYSSDKVKFTTYTFNGLLYWNAEFSNDVAVPPGQQGKLNAGKYKKGDTLRVGGGLFHINSNGFIHGTRNVRVYAVIPVYETTVKTLANNVEFEGFTIETPAWNSTDKYPTSVAFHQGRLFFGGSKGFPETVWGSKSGNYFNFSASGSALADDGLSIALDADVSVNVNRIIGTDRLYIFTTAGIFVSAANNQGAGFTPETFVFIKSTNDVVADVPVRQFDGSVVFVKDNGGIFEYLMGNDNARVSVNLATMAGDKIKDITDFAVSTNKDNSQFLWAVAKDGTMGVFHSNRLQKINAWTTVKTSGTVERVVSTTNGTVYILVKRTFASGEKYIIEKFNQATNLDCAITGTLGSAGNTITGLNHLASEKVICLGDGVNLGEYTVSSAGEITLSTNITDYQVGFGYDWEIKTMPLVVLNYQRQPVSARLRLRRVETDIDNATILRINDEVQTFSDFGSQQFDTSIGTFTGRAVTYHSAGMEDFVDVKVFGKSYEPLGVRSIRAIVERGS